MHSLYSRFYLPLLLRLKSGKLQAGCAFNSSLISSLYLLVDGRFLNEFLCRVFLVKNLLALCSKVRKSR